MRKILRGFALVVTFCLASCGHQEAGRATNDKRIAAVEIKYVGEKWINEDRLMRFIHVRAGTAYTFESVDSSIRALYESGYVEDVRVLKQPVGDNLRLIFEITSRPAIGQLGPPLFVGNTVFSDQRLARELDFAGRSKVEDMTDERLRKNASLIEKFYRREGYPAAKVKFRAFGGGPATPEDFQFAVEEGERLPSK
jgi:outer membrane protein insertion porin family